MKKKFFIFIIATLLMTSLTACSSSATPEATGEPKITGITIMDQKEEDPLVDMVTNYGTIQLKIYKNEVPEMAKNFLELAKEGKYDNTPFHRIIPGFVIQGGDITKGNGTGGHSYKGEGTVLKGEFNDKISSNKKGTISYANRGPDTNGSQFFINLADNVGLDNDKEPLTSQHPVFGIVIDGMDVVDKIATYKGE